MKHEPTVLYANPKHLNRPAIRRKSNAQLASRCLTPSRFEIVLPRIDNHGVAQAMLSCMLVHAYALIHATLISYNEILPYPYSPSFAPLLSNDGMVFGKSCPFLDRKHAKSRAFFCKTHGFSLGHAEGRLPYSVDICYSNALKSSAVMAPTRRICGWSLVQSTIVDDTPDRGISSPSTTGTCAANSPFTLARVCGGFSP